ncbi:Sporulation protein YtaF [Fictibacillus macauensis ZFHKF-1]|uniref:Sporulation protein YtaF n=1 Tax=Fictibacillus macauensis ZFHKF-1 TaxID=1196324 RepID=I8AI65_9BACL|nr:sporulation membrane protein YtaF [Fictibacillus macauensis]EIT85427.1 Sporulation protein YtaF [Fictibacillus macauensis ZFHKF-1]
MMSISILILAFAVSLDSFGTGLTYGMKQITIPLSSILIISLCSAIVFYTSMGFGTVLQHVLSPHAGKIVGGCLLIGLGGYFLYQAFQSKAPETVRKEKTIVKLEIKSLGIMIQILKKPAMADVDRSGSINSVEAILLGVALSLDAFGAGIGAALLHLPPLATALAVAMMSSLFVVIGMKVGYAAAKLAWMKNVSYLPGIVLILMGLLKLQ